MRVLVLTVTAGGGHNLTAKAIGQALESRGAEAKIVDMFEEISLPIKYTIEKGYLLAVKRLKKLYAKVYRMGEKRNTEAHNSYRKSTARFMYRLISRKMRLYIEKYQPDAIIYTHVFCGVVLDVIKQHHGLSAKTFGVVTDFSVHPFWEETLRSDYVVFASELMSPAVKAKGFEASQLLPIGIPIREQFSHIGDKVEARRRLGLAETTRTVLFMGGSMGYGNLAKTVKLIDKLDLDMQIIVVCGSNKKAKEELDAAVFNKRVLTLGFSDEIDLLMDAADCIITKPGGLTTSEALAKRLPMIICSPIPGQEDRNCEFLQNNGVAMKVSDTYSIAYAVYQMFLSHDKMHLMRRCIDMVRKPSSTATLCDLVIEEIKKTI